MLIFKLKFDILQRCLLRKCIRVLSYLDSLYVGTVRSKVSLGKKINLRSLPNITAI